MAIIVVHGLRVRFHLEVASLSDVHMYIYIYISIFKYKYVDLFKFRALILCLLPDAPSISARDRLPGLHG